MSCVEFFYDFRSPYAYFASQRLTLLSSKGADILWRPVSIDVLLNLQSDREPWAIYQDPLAPPKRAHLIADIARMARFWDIPLLPPDPRRPQSKQAMAIATFLSTMNVEHSAFRQAAFQALWMEQKDLADIKVIRSCLKGLDLSLLDDLEKGVEDLTNNSVAAYERGVFGVPTFVFGHDLYFGADRMEVLAKHL